MDNVKLLIKETFIENDIFLTDYEINKFSDFLKIFIEKNSKINLSAIREQEDIIIKHFLDSVMLNIFIDFLDGEKILDLGTGGGFPLIPLAITNPNNIFLGLDSVGKKVKVVNEFCEKLGLKNAQAMQARAEELGHNIEYREKFDFVVSRATAFFPVLLEYSIAFLKVGGVLCAYKLEDKEELLSIKKALKKLKAKILKVKKYKINGQERVIIFIKKLEKTSIKYPRKVGIPIQKPL